jgi:uncharacterized membrane protein
LQHRRPGTPRPSTIDLIKTINFIYRIRTIIICASTRKTAEVIMAVVAARTVSQVVTHMGIGFSIAWLLTGSALLGGLAVLIEPLINVLLVPLHEHAWHALRRRTADGRRRALMGAAEKVSQTAMHMVVAFGVMYTFTGSLASGGVAAVLEPVCNVILLPFHDRAFHAVIARLRGRASAV